MRLLQAQLGGLAQTVGTKGRQVNCGPQGEQALIRADIARRLLAANVLLARLEGQHPAALAGTVDGLAYEPTGNLPDEFLPARHDPQIRPAVAHRRAEVL